MPEKTQFVSLHARGQGICRGTLFSGSVFGRVHKFSFEQNDVEVRLPEIEFTDGSREPKGKNSDLVQFRSGRVDDTSPENSFYSVDYLEVRINIKDRVSVPLSTLENKVVQIPEGETPETLNLDRIAAEYDDRLVLAWRHWMRVARWATNQPQIGLDDLRHGSSQDLAYPRICENVTSTEVWASPVTFFALRSAQIDVLAWEHIQKVLSSGSKPPIWFEYLVEAHVRFERSDFSGCLLSSVIACETLVRAVFRRLAGAPLNQTAADLVDRTAAQAIIGRWKSLTGLKAAGDVHRLFDRRNLLVHNGHVDGVDHATATWAINTAQTFIEQGDVWWFYELGLPNPRNEFVGR